MLDHIALPQPRRQDMAPTHLAAFIRLSPCEMHLCEAQAQVEVHVAGKWLRLCHVHAVALREY